MTEHLKEKLPLDLDQDERTYISKADFIAGIINKVAKEYATLRQDSKAP